MDSGRLMPGAWPCAARLPGIPPRERRWSRSRLCGRL